MERKVKKHLSLDPVLVPLLDSFPFPPSGPSGEPVFRDLVKSIIYQQLSVRAAGTIYGRFLALFPGSELTPDNLLRLSLVEMRSAGLSRQKSGYLHEIAAAFITDEYRQKDWQGASEEEVMRLLCDIKGVGVWTAKMTLIFCLGRPDVFAPEDLGIRLAMKDLYRVELEGRKLSERLHEIAAPWRPYRSFACRYLWQWKDGGVDS